MISIITPTFNRAELIGKMIDSVINQTYSDWELIIVDDGSKDNTEEAIQQYLQDKRIRYIKKENSGATHSRNVGASHANGAFITFLDSDDEALPNWLEEVSRELDQDTGILCVGAIRKFNDGRTAQEYPYDYSLSNERVKIKFTCGSLIINRNIFNAIGGYDVKLLSNQHTDLGYRLLQYLKDKPLKKKSIHKCLIQINIHEGARIRTNWKLVSEGSIQFISKHYQFLLQNRNTKHISNVYSVIAFSFYKLKQRKKSIQYLFKSIQYNPSNFKNYLKVIKYSFL